MVKAAELASESAFLAGDIGEVITVVVVVNDVDAIEVAEKAVARAVVVAVAGVTEVLFRWIPLSLELVIPDMSENGVSFLGSSTSVKGD